MVSEDTPLLHSLEARNSTSNVTATANINLESFAVLLELVGARNLPVHEHETYAVIQFGGRTIHRTKPYNPKISKAMKIRKALRVHKLFQNSSTNPTLLERRFQNPIWTIQENAITAFRISKQDVDNNKTLKITLWSAPPNNSRRTGKQRIDNLVSVGKIQVDARRVISESSEERIELQLTNDLGKKICNTEGEPSLLAYRFRMASKLDIEFLDSWSRRDPTSLLSSPNSGDGIFTSHSTATKDCLITEVPEKQIMSAAPGINPIPPPAGYVRLKPYPNPEDPETSGEFITPLMLPNQTKRPAMKWIEAGNQSTALGRLKLEILSAHGLPNVDIGGAVGNETDAFATAIYGDTIVQTDVIFDELNPHWPCWSQRAFVFHMQHPSQVLYISLFGFKRSPLHHRPIGRIEVNPLNFSNGAEHSLEYELCGLSHAAERQSQGTIRIRLQIQIDDERKMLLAALRPAPPIYLNATKKKTMTVARYTSCGEYDNEEKFNLHVLHGYIDEVLEGYIRRILYALQDGILSVVLWRTQVIVLGIGLPLYSMMCFVSGILVVEHPRLLPTFICLGTATFFLQQMQQRLNSPSPWRRCHSFWHYFKILILGSNTRGHLDIHANEGLEKLRLEKEALKLRISHDKEFVEKKEAIERELQEFDKLHIHSKSKTIPVELLIVLGKVQAIVGDFCRLCRLVDAIVTWEESDIAFWITLSLIVTGLGFAFVPFGLLFQWTFRILVFLLLGPQNRLLDLFWYQTIPSDERRVYQVFVQRSFEARKNREVVEKTTSFRRSLFGKYGTWVPPVYWSPHMDFPLPASIAKSGQTTGSEQEIDITNLNVTHISRGQSLCGQMILRPPHEAMSSTKESTKMAQRAAQILVNSQAITDSIQELEVNRRISITSEEGFEIGDVASDELNFVSNLGQEPREESLRQLGFEILPNMGAGDNSDRSFRFESAWRSMDDIPGILEEGKYDHDENDGGDFQN